MTTYFEEYISTHDQYRQELKRILDKNFDFQKLIGAFDEESRLDKITLYRNLTKEEVDEFNSALDDNDINEAVKELADIFVVGSVYGSLQYDSKMVDYTWEVFDVNIDKLSIPEQNWTGMGESNTVDYILSSAVSMSRSFKFSFLEYLEAVIDNNFDKLPLKSAVEDADKDAAAIEELHKGRYKGVTYQEIVDAQGNERYKFVDSEDKVMKPIGYETIKFDIK